MLDSICLDSPRSGLTFYAWPSRRGENKTDQKVTEKVDARPRLASGSLVDKEPGHTWGSAQSWARECGSGTIMV